MGYFCCLVVPFRLWLLAMFKRKMLCEHFCAKVDFFFNVLSLIRHGLEFQLLAAGDGLNPRISTKSCARDLLSRQLERERKRGVIVLRLVGDNDLVKPLVKPIRK